ncbi:MAG TPA: M15 family metallopeptidase, partial [Actinotalea sp.]|nr:M15 family metallopeptidase [Actinotalea sp.]
RNDLIRSVTLADVHRVARRLLAHVLGGQGFVVHPLEWWHWELGTHYWAQVTGAATAVYDLVED